jgi:hypothetical protein
MGNRFGATVRRWAATLLLVAGMGIVGSTSATLLDRGPDMVYDDVLNITWTRQAGDAVFRNWADANAWAASLVFGGKDDWRLPLESVSAGSGPAIFVSECRTAAEFQCRDNELGYMFYHDLPDLGTFFQDKTGTQTALGGEVLTGIQAEYWSGSGLTSTLAWRFNFGNGQQLLESQSFAIPAWAVRAGDVNVAAVPEPASLLLFGVGILALGWTRRSGRRR